MCVWMTTNQFSVLRINKRHLMIYRRVVGPTIYYYLSVFIIMSILDAARIFFLITLIYK